MERIGGLQALRMVAVLLVAWLHAGQLSPHSLQLPNFGMFGVDIFFVISGFILSVIVLRGNQTPFGFLQRRAVRIFPVYWVFALYPFIHHVKHHEGFVYLPALFLLPGWQYPEVLGLANFGWTLAFEMFFYLLFSALLWFCAGRAAVKTMVCALLVLVILGMASDIRHPILIVAMNPMLLEFSAGACIALIYDRSKSRPMLGLLVIFAGTIAAWYCRYLPMTYEYDVLTNRRAVERSLTWGLAATLLVAGMVVWSPSMNSKTGKFMVLLGDASYSTYLLSGFLLLSYGSQLARLPLAQFTITFVLMGLGLAFYLYVERPLLKAVKRLLPASAEQRVTERRLVHIG